MLRRRSNVGKAIPQPPQPGFGNWTRASNKPGRTRELNFFNIADAITLIRHAGYGYAKAPKKEVKKWQSMLRGYLRGRPGLTRAFVLIDSRHGVLAADEEMFDLLDESAVTYQLVLTKIDKLKPAEVEKVYAETEDAAKKRSEPLSPIHGTSSDKFKGLEELRARNRRHSHSLIRAGVRVSSAPA